VCVVDGETPFRNLARVSCTALCYRCRLSSPSCAVLQALGAALPFEIAVGLNGIAWVNSGSARHTITICKAITLSETLDDAAAAAAVHRLLTQLKE
jgi:exosome complex RNA-binding protein Rrp4